MKKLALSPERGKRLLLHIEGCDYATRVWLNGKDCGAPAPSRSNAKSHSPLRLVQSSRTSCGLG